jgi:adenylate kinase family enzyme
MKRIVVLGVPGAGKSTFARKLGARLDLPVHHLDRYFWRPDWISISDEEFDELLEDLLSGDEWIIDGNYRRTIPMRLARADVAVVLDRPRWLAIARVLKRIARYRNGGRPDMSDGCPERLDWPFLTYIWRFHDQVAPQMEVHLQAFEKEMGRPVVRLSSDREADEWLASIGDSGT